MESESNIINASEALKKIKLPSWVKRPKPKLGFEIDQDGDRIFRVWLKVAKEFDPEKHDAELTKLEEDVRAALRHAGVSEWIIVSLDSGVVK